MTYTKLSLGRVLRYDLNQSLREGYRLELEGKVDGTRRFGFDLFDSEENAGIVELVGRRVWLPGKIHGKLWRAMNAGSRVFVRGEWSLKNWYRTRSGLLVHDVWK